MKSHSLQLSLELPKALHDVFWDITGILNDYLKSKDQPCFKEGKVIVLTRLSTSKINSLKNRTNLFLSDYLVSVNGVNVNAYNLTSSIQITYSDNSILICDDQLFISARGAKGKANIYENREKRVPSKQKIIEDLQISEYEFFCQYLIKHSNAFFNSRKVELSDFVIFANHYDVNKLVSRENLPTVTMKNVLANELPLTTTLTPQVNKSSNPDANLPESSTKEKFINTTSITSVAASRDTGSTVRPVESLDESKNTSNSETQQLLKEIEALEQRNNQLVEENNEFKSLKERNASAKDNSELAQLLREIESLKQQNNQLIQNSQEAELLKQRNKQLSEDNQRLRYENNQIDQQNKNLMGTSQLDKALIKIQEETIRTLTLVQQAPVPAPAPVTTSNANTVSVAVNANNSIEHYALQQQQMALIIEPIKEQLKFIVELNKRLDGMEVFKDIKARNHRLLEPSKPKNIDSLNEQYTQLMEIGRKAAVNFRKTITEANKSFKTSQSQSSKSEHLGFLITRAYENLESFFEQAQLLVIATKNVNATNIPPYQPKKPEQRKSSDTISTDEQLDEQPIAFGMESRDTSFSNFRSVTLFGGPTNEQNTSNVLDADNIYQARMQAYIAELHLLNSLYSNSIVSLLLSKHKRRDAQTNNVITGIFHDEKVTTDIFSKQLTLLEKGNALDHVKFDLNTETVIETIIEVCNQFTSLSDIHTNKIVPLITKVKSAFDDREYVQAVTLIGDYLKLLDSLTANDLVAQQRVILSHMLAQLAQLMTNNMVTIVRNKMQAIRTTKLTTEMLPDYANDLLYADFQIKESNTLGPEGLELVLSKSTILDQLVFVELFSKHFSSQQRDSFITELKNVRPNNLPMPPSAPKQTQQAPQQTQQKKDSQARTKKRPTEITRKVNKQNIISN